MALWNYFGAHFLQTGFQIFLHALLAMETNYIPNGCLSAPRQTDSGDEIFLRFFNPFSS